MKIDNSLFLQFSIGGVLAHFLFQYFNNQIWNVAIERSYFSIMSIFILLFVSWVWKFFEKGNENE